MNNEFVPLLSLVFYNDLAQPMPRPILVSSIIAKKHLLVMERKRIIIVIVYCLVGVREGHL